MTVVLVERRVASVTGLSLGLLCNPAGVAGVSVTVQGKAISLDRRQRPAGNTPPPPRLPPAEISSLLAQLSSAQLSLGGAVSWGRASMDPVTGQGWPTGWYSYSD